MVLADVNGLGSVIEKIGVSEDVYADFAPALQTCLYESLSQAVAEVFREAMVKRTASSSRIWHYRFGCCIWAGTTCVS